LAGLKNDYQREIIIKQQENDLDAGDINEIPSGTVEGLKKGIEKYQTDILDSNLLKQLAIGEGLSRIQIVKFSPDGKIFATGSADAKSLRVYDSISNNLKWSTEIFKKEVKQVEFFENGKKLMAFSNDFSLRTFDSETGKELQKLEELNDVANFDVPNNGNSVVLRFGSKVSLISWPKGGTLATIKNYDQSYGKVKFSNSGNLLAIGDTSKKLVLANGSTLGIIKELIDDKYNPVFNLLFSSDDKLLVRAGENDIKIYNIERDIWTNFIFNCENIKLVTLKFMRNDQILCTCSTTGEIRIWDVPNFKQIETIELAMKDDRRSLDINNEMTKLLISDNNNLILIDPKTKNRIKEFNPKKPMKKVMFCHEGAKIVSFTDDTVYVNDSLTGLEINKFEFGKEDPAKTIIDVDTNLLEDTFYVAYSECGLRGYVSGAKRFDVITEKQVS
jgi:WD40 repeat protein